jgi:hypothetical protein
MPQYGIPKSCVCYFLIKIFVTRILYVVKQYPVIAAGTVLLVFSFLAVEINTTINLDTKKCIPVTVVLMLSFAAVSLKKRRVTPAVIAFSKSGFTNKTIHALFFISRSIINNGPLVLFNLIVLKRLITVERFIYVSIITIVSLLSSFCIMNVRNKFTYGKTIKEKINKRPANPLVKSAVCDYGTPDFFQTAVTAVSLFSAVLFELLKDADVLREMEHPFILVMRPAAALSFGFMGIVDSIPHTNWKFYALISPYNFNRQFRKTLLFLAGFSGFL